MDIKIVKKLTKMQKEYSKLYNQYDIRGIDSYKIHVTEKLFKELVNQFKLGFYVSDRQDDKYPYLVTTYFDNVRFITVGTKEELESVGLL